MTKVDARVNTDVEKIYVAEKPKNQRKNFGKQVAEEVEAEAEYEELVEFGYEQEPEDIVVDTCIDPTKNWDSLQVQDIPRAKCGSRSDIDDGSDGENDERG